MIGKFRHLRNFNPVNDAVANRNLRIWEGFAKRKAERAKVAVDVALGARVEVARQRPVSGSRHKHGIHGDQESGAQDGLRAEVEPQKREAASSKSKCHAASPEYGL